MELKEYTKNLKNKPLLNNSRCSYYFYRLTDDSIALVVYDHERKKCNFTFHTSKNKK